MCKLKIIIVAHTEAVYRLVKNTSQLLIKTPDCQQPDSTITDALLQALGLDKTFMAITS